MQLTFRQVEADDMVTVQHLLGQLASVEGTPDAVTAPVDALRAMLVGSNAFGEAILAHCDGLPCGLAIFFIKPSTYRARPALYIEDLVVDTGHRGRGIGRAIMHHLMAIGRERDCWRMEWSAVDHNSGALGFYNALDATVETGRTHLKLEL